MGRQRRSVPLVQRRRSAPGVAPGTVSIDPQAHPSRLSVITYNAEVAEEHAVADVARVGPLRRADRIIWVAVEGLGDAHVLEELARLFRLHPLALEDVVNVHQRPKVEAYDDHLYCAMRMFGLERGELDVQQVSLFMGEGFVLTLEERACGCLDPVRRRLLQAGPGRLRRSGADYLAYTVLDAVVDRYFPVLHALAERLEELEDRVLDPARQELIPHIHHVRRELLLVRRSVWPLGEAISRLLREEAEADFISAALRPYLRDLHDHTIQLKEGFDLCISMVEGLMEAYRSAVTMRANEVMRVLTVFASFFLPLSFVASLYGMNFNPRTSPLNMPELDWYFGYPLVLVVMAAIGGGLLLYFQHKGWLGGPPRGGEGAGTPGGDDAKGKRRG
ncbi:MAG: magnesium and cobalt transport protein CorA [Nitrospirae bacterium CG06_land_8_20_14_3_00_70_43]|nr:MAG: magnesium and cobalt transport protein CorA [Nitrospirae bacterium CG06_land_8_20_14_3_00_70_43]PJB95828.1 MAG: magnesium and cobalt transport protein CorA [Nitrospirae bacterium CG_4_9_14_0_8_um_filter_70_14]